MQNSRKDTLIKSLYHLAKQYSPKAIAPSIQDFKNDEASLPTMKLVIQTAAQNDKFFAKLYKKAQ